MNEYEIIRKIDKQYFDKKIIRIYSENIEHFDGTDSLQQMAFESIFLIP